MTDLNIFMWTPFAVDIIILKKVKARPKPSTINKTVNTAYIPKS